MASKGPKQRKKNNAGGGGDQLASGMQALSVSGGQQLALFPPRPRRDGPAPGTVVQLLTNLFKINVQGGGQSKPIYKYVVEVEKELEEAPDKASKPNDPPRDVKLRKELRREIVIEAINTWFKSTKPKDQSSQRYSYVFDSKAATVYALFDMFAAAPNEKALEFRVAVPLDEIRDQKCVLVKKNFRVKMLKGGLIQIGMLVEYCKGVGNQDVRTVQEQLRALNAIVGGRITSIPINHVTANCIFPFKRENQHPISPGVMINKGYHMSVRPTADGIALNVANTVGAFYEEVDLIYLLQNRFFVRDLTKPLHAEVVAKLKREVFNKQIEAQHINYGTKEKPHFRKYRVGNIEGTSMDKFMLVGADKVPKETTIKDYFFQAYKVKLKYPNLPCIVDRGRKLPLEVCRLMDRQHVARRLDPEETAEVIKKASVPPNQYFRTLKGYVDEINENSQPLKEFGLQFTPVPIDVEGRELRPTALVGGSKKAIFPRNGQYDVRNDRFYKPAMINKWAMMFLLDRRASEDKQRNGQDELFARKFSGTYCKHGADKGVRINPLEPANVNYLPLDKPEAQLRQLLKNYLAHLNTNKVNHAIFVLPNQCPEWAYRYLQYLEASVKVGRGPTESCTRISCIKYQNYMQKIINDRFGGTMFIANLWLKYNTKLGGINFVLDPSNYHFLKEGWMFISLDVCHPAPGDKLVQSVAAAVGMWDLTSERMSHCTRMRVQKKMRENHSTVEEVGEIGPMVEEILDAYKQRKGKLPTNVVILRDGVSEGQFRMVLEFELARVKAAMSKIYTASKLPKPALLTCLVVQKRHKVRFMRKTPVSTPKGDDFNIQPGTVVDTKIVHPTDFSFYLAPHKAIQGTSRPAHIYMILDENKFSQDAAQSMIHSLSYLSPRCTKSTSIPTPVNLADLAAERGKNLVISWNDENVQKMNDDERIRKLNEFLANIGDNNYRNTLFYI